MLSRNLVRFDWAIKRLLRNKAEFSVLEGFISELLKEDIKIERIVGHDGSQSDKFDKSSCMDILAANTKDEPVIIEIHIQNEFVPDYFQQMTYRISKFIKENISAGEKLQNLKKFYSINLAYFDLGIGKDYIYHGKNEFVGIHDNPPKKITKQTKEIFETIVPYSSFPEYYLIKVNQFDDNIEKPIDQWIYYFKNNEIKDDFTAKGILKAKELWRVDSLPEDEKKKYFRYIEDL